MGWTVLSFLAEPWFVIPWYAIGLLGLAYVAWDVTHANRRLPPAMRWAWPIIALFFSVIGVVLYVATARRERPSMFGRVNGAVIHCVAGDGLGIMTAMVIARATSLTFWEEFWFEYVVGFCFGWFIFQRKSMTMMTDSTPKALAMAFRAEFFSMLTVMGGMGAVMTFVTPATVGAQPKPLTYAFWGFGMLGLLAGYVLTFPMNWMIVKVGWKHGMGPEEDARPVKRAGAKVGLVAAMLAIGAGALALVAWLTERREATPIAGAPSVELAPDEKLGTMQLGLFETVIVSSEALAAGHRRDATAALDAARRVAEVGADAFPRSGFRQALHDIEDARHALEMGRPRGCRAALALAFGDTMALRASKEQRSKPLRAYAGSPVLNAQGRMIGELARVDGDRVELALGGGRDVFGFWDLHAERVVTVPAKRIVFGPTHHLGRSFVMLPTLETAPATVVALCDHCAMAQPPP